MSRYITVSIFGILFLFLTIYLMAIIGVGSMVKTLERKALVNQIKSDIEFMESKFNSADTSFYLCRDVLPDLAILQTNQLKEDCTNEEIETARWLLIQASRKTAQCFKEKTSACVKQNIPLCTKTSLFTFVKSLDISGRHLGVEFSEKEKKYYQTVTKLNARSINNEKLSQIIDQAFPVFEETMKKVNNEFAALKNGE